MARPKVADLLAQEEAQAPAVVARPKVSDLAAKEAEDPGFWSKAMEYGLKPIAWAGKQIDRVTTAPVRAALDEVRQVREDQGRRQSGLANLTDPEEWKDIGRFGAGYLRNFGRDPDEIPSPKETMESYGVPDTPLSNVLPSLYSETGEGAKLKRGGFLDPTASGTAGMAAELAAPLPGLSTVKTAVGATGKAVGPVARMAAEGGAKALDVATGTKIASKTLDASKAVAEGVGNLYKGAKEGLGKAFDAKQADDFGESVKTAMANGIDPKLLPEAVEFGPNSIVTRTARVQAEGIAGQPLLDKFQEGLDQVRGAVRNNIERIGGGAPLSKPEAGAVLREGFNQGVDRAFSGINTSHRGIIEAAPDLRLSQEAIADLAPKLNELETWAKAKSANGLTKTAQEQGKQILRAIEKLRGKGEAYSGAYEALQEIGEVAFKKSNSLADVPPDIARFRKLYGDISDAMISTVDDAFGAGQGQALRDANKAMHKIFGDKSLLGKIGDNSLSDERLFQSLIEQGDTKRIAALKEYLEPEQLAALKGAFLDGLIKADPEGKFPFRSLHNALRQKNTVASVLFEPGELDNVQSLLKLGDKFGNAVMSSSGTGSSNALREGIKEIGNSAADAAVSQGIKNKARAIGFDIEEMGGKAAAKNPGPGPVMGLDAALPKFMEFRAKNRPVLRGSRAWSQYEEDEEE